MEIVVLVKQVPDTESLIEIAEDGVSIKKQDIKWVMNPYDEIAVEAGAHALVPLVATRGVVRPGAGRRRRGYKRRLGGRCCRYPGFRQ